MDNIEVIKKDLNLNKTNFFKNDKLPILKNQTLDALSININTKQVDNS